MRKNILCERFQGAKKLGVPFSITICNGKVYIKQNMNLCKDMSRIMLHVEWANSAVFLIGWSPQ